MFNWLSANDNFLNIYIYDSDASVTFDTETIIFKMKYFINIINIYMYFLGRGGLEKNEFSSRNMQLLWITIYFKKEKCKKY